MLGITVWQEASLIFLYLVWSTLPVGQGDLKSLHSELHPVTDKWFSLGVQLQIPVQTLKCIEAEYNQMNRRLLEMLTVWLRCPNPPPTWNILTEALESLPVGEKLLAQQLRDKYCPSTERGSTHGYPFQGPATLVPPNTLGATGSSKFKSVFPSSDPTTTPTSSLQYSVVPHTLPSSDAANYSAPDSSPTETAHPNLPTDNTGIPT